MTVRVSVEPAATEVGPLLERLKERSLPVVNRKAAEATLLGVKPDLKA